MPDPPPAQERLPIIDGDTGPAYVLEGRIVPMTRDGPFDGRLAVRGGRIAAVVRRGQDLPADLAGAPVVPAIGTVFPGLIDLHNHYVYDVAPLWRVPRLYTDRSEWANVASKKAEVSLPLRLLAGWEPTARAIARYVEAKALLGGTTTGQGMNTQVRGGWTPFRGAMRNVEATEDPRLPDAATLVPTLGRRASDFAAFGATLDRLAASGGAYFYHLAEGVRDISLRTYTDLRDNGILRRPLVGIHGLALGPDDLGAVAAAGVGLVWSPFSNLLLYGRTLDTRALLASGARFAIGADWSPSGSKNLLHELKVARWVARSQGRPVSARRLVAAVTSEPAALLGWGAHLGALRPGAFADLLVVAGVGGDPYEHLVDAREADVRLVTVHGTPRYGDADVMGALGDGAPGELEAWSVGEVRKAFRLASPASPIDSLGLADAVAALRAAMGDLPAFRAEVERGVQRLRERGIVPEDTFSLALDNEPEGGPVAVTAADWALLPPSLPLDEPVVGEGDHWARLDDQPNIDSALKAELRRAYGAGGER